MKINTLNDLFLLKLKALYDVESKLVKALPTMAKHASNAELKDAFETHYQETREHVVRLEKIFGMIGAKPSKTDVEGISGIIADAEWSIKQKPSPAALDALLIASARYAEHYEIAGYLTLIAWADLLGYSEAAEALEMTLDEERNADGVLSSAAEDKIDRLAMAAEE